MHNGVHNGVHLHELEHLKIETRLTMPIFALSCPRKAARLKWKVPRFIIVVVYYESIKRELKIYIVLGDIFFLSLTFFY